MYFEMLCLTIFLVEIMCFAGREGGTSPITSTKKMLVPKKMLATLCNGRERALIAQADLWAVYGDKIEVTKMPRKLYNCNLPRGSDL